jgi:uridylate kinase
MVRYNRILLKLSGEALMGNGEFGIDSEALAGFAKQIAEIHALGVQIGVVIGGGNIFRGIQSAAHGIHRVSGDYMGMLATVINSIAFQNALEDIDIDTRLQSAIKMEQIAEPLIRRRAIRHLEKNRVVIFGAGTGYPYFTTDTAASLRAVEIEAEAIIKCTRVNGIYDSDPEKNPDAKHFDTLTYSDIISKNLRVMDLTAITLCSDNKLPIVVLDINKKDNLKQFMLGENTGTIVN